MTCKVKSKIVQFLYAATLVRFAKNYSPFINYYFELYIATGIELP